MNEYALVLNAGSSSLKFCVYRRPVGQAWDLEARGQVDGIGTTPRFSAKDGAGAPLADEKLEASVKDGRAALDVLAMSVDEARFRQPVRPGDVLRMNVEVLKHRGDIFKFKGRALVGEKLVAQVEFAAMVVETR